MDLIVFDLDGTLLNKKSQVSEHTRDTLRQLRERDIAYTVATGAHITVCAEFVGWPGLHTAAYL